MGWGHFMTSNIAGDKPFRTRIHGAPGSSPPAGRPPGFRCQEADRAYHDNRCSGLSRRVMRRLIQRVSRTGTGAGSFTAVIDGGVS